MRPVTRTPFRQALPCSELATFQRVIPSGIALHISPAKRHDFSPPFTARAPEESAIPGQRPIRSHSLAQSEASGQVSPHHPKPSAQRASRSPCVVRSTPELPTRWASKMIMVGPVSWADADRSGPGYLNGWAFGPESHATLHRPADACRSPIVSLITARGISCSFHGQ